MKDALDAAAEIVAHFVATVLEDGVFSSAERERPTGPGDAPQSLSADRAKQIGQNKAIDHRTPYLMRLSGKGGRPPEGIDPDRYLKFRNVTLLDHLTSVTRGALVIGAIDLVASGVTGDALKARLAKIAATAFLHDADKMLQKRRGDPLTPADFDALAERYQVNTFLAPYGPMTGAEHLERVSNAEVSQHDRLVPGGELLSREAVDDCAYVRLADRLDGKFLKEGAGVDAVVDELAAFKLRTHAFPRDWRALTVRAPQTPFLLDALQMAFADALFDQTGLPPLVEVHQDGELTLIAPAASFDAALDTALEGVARAFSKGLRVATNNRGARDLLDGRGGIQELRKVLARNTRECTKALFVHRALVEDGPDAIKSELEKHFSTIGPNWRDLDKAGQHLQPYPLDDQTDSRIAETLVDAAAIVFCLAASPPKDRALAARTPDEATREAELVETLAIQNVQPPAFLTDLPDRPHRLSRHTLVAVHAAMAARDDLGLHDDLFGPDGLLETWLVGRDERAGILEKNEEPGKILGGAAIAWLKDQCNHHVVRTDVPDDAPRCHFTNLPVTLDRRIDGKDALYGLNVSAFSGREGRPESHISAKSQTLVSPVAQAEHRLRAITNESARGDVPVFVSSPSSNGLFWSLLLTGQTLQLASELSLYDVLRVTRDGGKSVVVEQDAAAFTSRALIGRFANLPTRVSSSGTTPGLVGFAAMVVDTARRAGRPIHVFRGLPRRSNAFVTIDCLPRPIERALEQAFGSTDLRVEDLAPASKLLRLVDGMIEENAIGADIALHFAHPATRLGAGSLALAALDRKDGQHPLRADITELTRTAFMDTDDDPIIAFAKAMTAVQRTPRYDASNSEKDLGMTVALAGVEGAITVAHASRDSLVHAVAGGLENELTRGRVGYVGQKFPEDAARHAATVFVDRVWGEALGARSPASRARRTVFAIYRFAFLEHGRAKFSKTEEPDDLVTSADA